MLLTLVDILSCENPQCREFAHIVPRVQGVKMYYCQVCGTISHTRAVDAALAASPARYEEYLRHQLELDRELMAV